MVADNGGVTGEGGGDGRDGELHPFVRKYP